MDANGRIPIRDKHYLEREHRLPELEHRYGDRVRLLDDPYLFSLLARASSPACDTRELTRLMRLLYRGLAAHVANAEFPSKASLVRSRMEAFHPQGCFEARIIDPTTLIVCVGLARAGLLPSQELYEAYCDLLDPKNVRQDFIAANRRTDAEDQVVGTDVGSVKVGGPVDGRMILLPDPMGATGSTVVSAVERYLALGSPKSLVAIHLIVTPEYLDRVLTACPSLRVYALRLDRGLSTPEVLQTSAGTRWKEEKGLNQKQYIVPGAGGIGELLFNALE